MSTRCTIFAQRFLAGESMAGIARDHNISRERVRQVLKRAGLIGRDGGLRVRSRERVAREATARDARSLDVHGCSHAEYLAIKAAKCAIAGLRPTRAFVMQRNNARRRGIAWNLTLAEWWKIWQDSGHWLERGRHRYGMGRRDNSRGFDIGNVEIRPHWSITVAPVVRGYGGWAVPLTEPAGESSLGTLRAGATGRASSSDGVRPSSPRKDA